MEPTAPPKQQPPSHMRLPSSPSEKRETQISTAWKVSKYGVISGPYFPVFGLNTGKIIQEKFSLNTGKYGPEITAYLDTFHAVFLTFDFSKKLTSLTCAYQGVRNASFS